LSKVRSAIAAFLLGFIQFLPLSLFLLVQRTSQSPELIAKWREAFMTGGAVASTVLIAFVFLRVKLDRLLLATNIFLIVAMLAFTFDQQWLIAIYHDGQESMLPLFVLLSAAVLLAFPGGFIGDHAISKQHARISCFVMIFTALIAGGFAWQFRGQTWLAGSLPFLFMLIVQRVMSFRFRRLAATTEQPQVQHHAAN